MKNKKVWILISILAIGFLVGFSFSGCSAPLNFPQPSELMAPQDFNNGVYYFPCNKGIFAGSLAKFKGEHSELIVTAISGDGTGSYGTDIGYYVNTEVKTSN
jgi:hypothetical protein